MKVHYSSKSDEWETPQAFFDKYNKIYQFDLDACATKENTKCVKYFSLADDGLSQSWIGNVWCNPPYSQLKLWIKKAYEESLNGNVVVMLIPARTDTIAWHEYIFTHAQVEFIKGRLKFGDSKNTAPFPSAIVVFGATNNLNKVKLLGRNETILKNPDYKEYFYSINKNNKNYHVYINFYSPSKNPPELLGIFTKSYYAVDFCETYDIKLHYEQTKLL